MDNCIGEYGVCIDDLSDGRFRYLIAGKYTGGPVPEGMVLYEFPRGEWAVFDCVGPNPQTLQSVNTRIFQEWLPGNLARRDDGRRLSQRHLDPRAAEGVTARSVSTLRRLLSSACPGTLGP